MANIIKINGKNIKDKDAVHYSVADGASDAQKAQARANIDAAGVNDVKSALSNFAGEFSTSTPYSAGQYVTYTDGKFYRFTADHAAGAWTGTDVVAVTAGGEIWDLNTTNIRASPAPLTVIGEQEIEEMLKDGCVRKSVFSGNTITETLYAPDKVTVLKIVTTTFDYNTITVVEQ